jgi:siroheme synthase
VALTHREHAHGVVFVTGHAKPGDDGTDWRALAATARDAKLTLVIYMGVSGAQRIQDELLTGLAASTPVAIVQRASLPDQRHAVTTLGQLHATIEREQLASPSVIVVGDVVGGMAAAQQAPAYQRSSYTPAQTGVARGRMLEKLNEFTESHGALKPGRGLITGVIALSLAILCFLGVLAFHFP